MDSNTTATVLLYKASAHKGNPALKGGTCREWRITEVVDDQDDGGSLPATVPTHTFCL